jgi:hypothetical protein
MRGETLLSADLDVYTSSAGLHTIVASVRVAGVPILKEPRPRNVPVAVFEWEGL